MSFYGFAESNETEINYNYAVVVDEILVTPGQEVKTGDVMLKLSRLKSKETLVDQPFRIAELRSEAKLWDQRKRDQIEREKLDVQQIVSGIDTEISELKEEIVYRKSIVDGLKTIEPVPSSYDPIKQKIAILEEKRRSAKAAAQLRIEGFENELALGKNPFALQQRRLQAEADFDESQKVQNIVVSAPSDGLIGNVYCKEAEHVPSYRTLLSFYEPHSGLIKGYVHEDLTLEVELDNKFSVSSLKDASLVYEGKVIGLGSRIVEIPVRLRKLADFKTYGREVLIEIPKSNKFLQKEKVALSYVGQN